jgi:argininosuccinate lyase
MKNQSKKLWDKGVAVDEIIEKFTVGEDRNLDIHLAEFDVLGSLAHIHMLQKINLLTPAELKQLKAGLIALFKEIKSGNFEIGEGVEDVHSQVELLLTKRQGDIGKKIHSGRSRNDQILLDLKLFTRTRITRITEDVNEVFNQLIDLSEKHKDVLLPGYTHLQVAMPSSFGLWFGAYAESLVDDMLQLLAAYKISNKNPLGSAAGYGSSFPLDRALTTKLLGFDDLNYNSVYAQMGRGKVEKIVLQAIASVAETLSRMCMDITLYMSQNFGFVSFPDNLTTGSSIMPHKKNPDLFEILRARCNRIKSLPNQLMMIYGNLPSGYHRDLQLIKESYIPALLEISECLNIFHFALKNIKVNTQILNDKKYDHLYTVDAVNELVSKGVTFREAYRQVGDNVEKGVFKKPEKMEYTHVGSIGNLSNSKIKSAMEEVLKGFNFIQWQKAVEQLVI